MKSPINFKSIIIAGMAFVIFTACSELAGTDQNTSSDVTVDNTLGLLKSSTIDQDLTGFIGVAHLGWREMKKPGSSEPITATHAMAALFASPLTSDDDPKNGGIDAGELTLSSESGSLPLDKQTLKEGGVIYQIKPPKRGETPQSLQYQPNDEYQFSFSGTDQVPALQFSVESPDAISFTNVSENDQINIKEGLTLNWEAPSASKIMIHLMPVPDSAKVRNDRSNREGKSRGINRGNEMGRPMNPGMEMLFNGPKKGQRGNGHPKIGLHVELDAGVTSYTFSSEELSSLVQDVSTTDWVLAIGQVVEKNIQLDNGQIKVLLSNGSHQTITLQ